MVSGYFGREIPDWRRVGLDAERMYQLYRDPFELKRAASTFAGKPILIEHTAVSPGDHPFTKVVGAIGDDVRFDAPFLKASLSIWTDEAIDAIESGSQRELSCGYKYSLDLTPGTFAGETYDGVMRDIAGNHLALVSQGRCGASCAV